MSDRYRNPPSVVVLTALNVEYEAVRGMLADLHRASTVSGTRFETGSLGGGGEIVLALTGQGNHSAAVIAERALREFSPLAILFVGVAGRLQPSMALGDVVVATHVYAYHGAAARTDGLKSRPRVWEIDHGIEQAARQLARHHERARAADTPGPRVHFGPLASGEVLHDAAVSVPLSWIREHYDDALAIEMEAAGVAKAGQLNAAPVAVIRAISDRADGTKSGTDADSWQPRAVHNAAVFATALAADLITEHPPREQASTGEPQVRIRTRGGSHGAVAGIVNGGVHNGVRPGRAGHQDRG